MKSLLNMNLCVLVRRWRYGAYIVAMISALDPAPTYAASRADTCWAKADIAAQNQQTNIEKKCGYTGEDWNSQASFHFDICMQRPGRYDRALQRQRSSLDACAQRIQQRKLTYPGATN